MRKFVSFIPVITLVFTALWGLVDNSVFAYLGTHNTLVVWLGLAFVISETLAGTEMVKSNSVVQAIFDLVMTVLRAVLKKPATN
jgi:hypothetical protein